MMDATVDHVSHVAPKIYSRELVEEILHWEDEFLGFAGHPRKVRP